jgi:outer membrane protein assembly factor BamA
VAGISADHRWDQGRDVRQTAAGSYQLRAGTGALDSDLVYQRHLWQARYQYDRDRATVIGSFSAGYISGEAPIFERFSLGDSSTLRGWSKFDVAPAGGERMFHQSLEFRYSHVAVFFDSGSVWGRSTDSRIRYSTGFGIHGDNGFLTVAFPLNADQDSATFMMGIRF